MGVRRSSHILTIHFPMGRGARGEGRLAWIACETP